MSHKNKQKIFLPISVFIYLLVNSCSQSNYLITPTVTSAPTALPTPIIEATPTPSLKDVAGLIYKLENELWFIDENGDAQFLFAFPQDVYTFDILFLQDNIQIVYARNGDIWFVDLQTQEQKNITNTPDRFEKTPKFWVGRPDIVIFESLLIADYSPFVIQRASGSPAIVDTNGENYKVIDENGSGSIFLSSDGKKILYRLSEDLIATYSWENSQIEVIDTNLYELPLDREKGIFIQTWSPDERYLAGRIGGYLTFGESFQIGIAIIDLKAKTSKTLHLISPKAGGDVLHYLSWSPNGEWIVFTMHADPSYPDEFISLWLMEINTGQEIHTDEGGNPIWHENSQRFAYDRKAKALVDGIWIYDLEAHSKFKTSLPDEAILVDWVSLDQ